MIFDWIHKDCMSETILDHVCKTICVVSSLLLINGIAYLTERFEKFIRKEH